MASLSIGCNNLSDNIEIMVLYLCADFAISHVIIMHYIP